MLPSSQIYQFDQELRISANSTAITTPRAFNTRAQQQPRASPRTVVVTGAATGIGKAAVELLRLRGDLPIGVDRLPAEHVAVVADLATRKGCSAMVEEIARLSAGVVDGVIANAGTASQDHSAIQLNFFGAVRTLEGMLPLLQRSKAPRAVVTGSIATLMPVIPEIVAAAMAGDEQKAVELAKAAANDPLEARKLYSSSKRALARWVRKTSISEDWQRIPINAVGPTVIHTPMVEPMLKDEAAERAFHQLIPLPLHEGQWGEPEEVARLLIWLAGEENSLTTGQMIFIDGGYDAKTRGEDIWDAQGASPLEYLAQQ